MQAAKQKVSLGVLGMSLDVGGHIDEEPFHRNVLGRRWNCPGACWTQKQPSRTEYNDS